MRHGLNEMIVSIMQPYFFPYLGYFQLMAASDTFVVYDDVQFIKGGWVHRNRILLNGGPVWMTLPIASAAHTLEIRHREYLPGREHRTKLLRRLEGAYRKAPNFDATMGLVERILNLPDENIATLNTHALREVASAIGIRTKILVSSSLGNDDPDRGAQRVAGICKKLGASVYLNSIGGTGLYDAAFFRAHQLDLRFIEPGLPAYPQASTSFVPALSIIDVLMNNDFAAVGPMLSQCRILRGEELKPGA